MEAVYFFLSVNVYKVCGLMSKLGLNEAICLPIESVANSAIHKFFSNSTYHTHIGRDDF